MKALFATDESWSSLILRVMLGVVMFPHGAQKLLGWFGGFGFAGTMGFFTDKMHLPAVIAFLVIIGESLGSLGLILGFLTRITAASYVRSEEHTSELQSLAYLVCRLLLEKKKTIFY